MAGWAGGSLVGHSLFPFTWMPEAFFALPFVYVLWKPLRHYAWLAGIWVYLFFQSATWPILPWWKEGVRSLDRDSTLKPIADWIAGLFDVRFDTEAYAWIYAAMRGFFITLPVGGTGALFSPLAREIGSHFSHHAITECLEGAGFGLSILIFSYMVRKWQTR